MTVFSSHGQLSALGLCKVGPVSQLRMEEGLVGPYHSLLIYYLLMDSRESSLTERLATESGKGELLSLVVYLLVSPVGSIGQF